MKKILYLSPFLLLAIYFFSYNKKSDMPSFKLLFPDSITVLNTQDIPEGKPSIFLFFSPDCEHCQSETSSLLKSIDSLKNVNFYFVTIDSMHQMKVFNGYYKLFQYPNIIIGRDYTYSFPRHFKGATPPYSVVYDGHKRIRFIFNGEATASQFITVVNKL